MKQVKGGVTAAKGFEAASTAAGIKYKDRTDMALVYSQVPCVAAGTFTTNVVKAAPVKWDQQVVKSGAKAQAVVVNSGIANACTGAEGFGYCKDTADAAAKALNVPISLHEEDPAFIRNNGINHGKVSDELGIYGSPSIAEESLVARDCLLALRSGADVVIQHISSGVSVELVRTYKKLGANLHAEATPHHFSLTEDAVLEHGTLAKMNPPLRTEKDRQQIIAGLADGTIDLIATDHAPHSAEEKSRPITEAPSGIIGLETSLALGITNLVKPGHLTMLQLLEKMTVNPAKLYHLPYGTIQEGADADFVLFDPDETWTPTEYASKSSNSPFTGKELTGKVKYTICGGKIVYADVN